MKFFLEREKFTLDVDIELPGTGVSVLFGPSGSGKTSLLRAIAGLDRHEGYLRVGDQTWQDAGRFVATHLRGLAYVFQEASLFPHLNVEQNLRYAYKRRAEGSNPSWSKVIGHLEIDEFLSRGVESLSGGERQRIAVARALLSGPRLLLMDEPLAGLDLGAKYEILPRLQEVQRSWRIPVIYVSHSLEEVARLADYLVLLESGRVTSHGDVHDLLARTDLPLSRQHQAGAIVEAEIVGHDETYQLSRLQFAGGSIFTARVHREIGQQVRLKLAARDISISLEKQEGTSILNHIPATIVELNSIGPAHSLVKLSANGVPILARITHKSAKELKLAPGMEVYAQIKSVALLEN